LIFYTQKDNFLIETGKRISENLTKNKQPLKKTQRISIGGKFLKKQQNSVFLKPRMAFIIIPNEKKYI
jgi:hypothetical protein